MDLGPNADGKSHALSFFRSVLSNRRLILAIGIVAVAGGLHLKRDWLVTVGVAPVLIGLLPCAAMCALGLCMGGMKKSNGNIGTTDTPKIGSEGSDEDRQV